MGRYENSAAYRGEVSKTPVQAAGRYRSTAIDLRVDNRIGASAPDPSRRAELKHPELSKLSGTERLYRQRALARQDAARARAEPTSYEDLQHERERDGWGPSPYFDVAARNRDRFTALKPKLSERGQAFVDDVQKGLFADLAEVRTNDRARYDGLMGNEPELERFARDSHFKRITDGAYGLPVPDLKAIAEAVDTSGLDETVWRNLPNDIKRVVQGDKIGAVVGGLLAGGAAILGG
jgi:hypothetical protein